MAVRKEQLIKGAQMCIVTGPRIELAITLIDRMKGLFQEILEKLLMEKIFHFLIPRRLS